MTAHSLAQGRTGPCTRPPRAARAWLAFGCGSDAGTAPLDAAALSGDYRITMWHERADEQGAVVDMLASDTSAGIHLAGGHASASEGGPLEGGGYWGRGQFGRWAVEDDRLVITWEQPAGASDGPPAGWPPDSCFLDQFLFLPHLTFRRNGALFVGGGGFWCHDAMVEVSMQRAEQNAPLAAHKDARQ
jgi:hypothetical protein